MARFVLTAQLNIQAPNNVNQVVRQIQSQLDNVRINVQVNNARQARSQIDGLTDSVDRATSSSERLGRVFATSVRRFTALAVATRAVSLFTNTLSKAVDEAIKFERELVRVSQVTGKTISQLSSLTNTITSLSTSLGVSSTSLINVSTILSQAGFNARDTEIALKTLAQTNLSPTFDDITETTEGAIAIFNQFRAGAAALEDQLGSVNAVSAAFAVESSDLIDVVRRTGGVFKASGGSLNELLALFTSVRATTRESAESIGTGLRTIFTRIQRPKTIEFLKQFGVELIDLQGKFVGPFEAVKRLSQALAGLEQGDVTFIRVAEELGGFRQIGKVIPLLQQFAIAQEALNVAQEGAGSLAADAASAQQALAVRIIKVKEEFLALVRGITQTGTFQVLADTTLKLASALIKLADSLKPVIPLLLTFASIRAAQGIGGFLGGISAGLGGGGGRRMSSGGKVHYFARGGFVPGTGNRDTVPAMLSPGEFVIRKSSVNKIGAENLAAMNENRFQKGGKQGTRRSVQEKLEAEDGVKSTFKINDQQIQAVIRAAGDKDPQDKELDIGAAFLQPEGITRSTKAKIDKTGIDAMLKSVSSGLGGTKSLTKTFIQDAIGKFNSISIGITSGSLSKDVAEQYKNGINTSLTNFSSKFASQTFQNNPPFDSGKFSSALNRANIEQVEGNIFEAFVNGLSNSPFTDTKINPNDTFDFPFGLGSAGSLFNLDPSLLSDAKRTFSEESLGSLAKKGTNKLVEGFRSIVAQKLIDQNIGGDDREKLNREKAALAEKRVSVRKKFFGGLIQKFAKGGMAQAPLVDDILQATGSILPQPSKAIQALIKSGGGAVDIDRTLKRTIGDAAYAKAPTPEAKGAALKTYFRDEAKRLQDLKASPLTQFGAELQKAIKSGLISPNKLSIISKSRRVKGAAEYLSQLFGIPTANMIFTQGGSKQPALDAMRTKGPRSTRVSRFATGGSVGTDTVPALLTPGEFVINKQSAQAIGYGSLNKMNKVGKYAKGGIVGVQKFAKGGQADTMLTQAMPTVNANTTKFAAATLKLEKVLGILTFGLTDLYAKSQDLKLKTQSNSSIMTMLGVSGEKLINALEVNNAANQRSIKNQDNMSRAVELRVADLINASVSEKEIEQKVEKYIQALDKDTQAKLNASQVKTSPVTTASVTPTKNVDQEIANTKRAMKDLYVKQYQYEASTARLAQRGITDADAIAAERKKLLDATRQQYQAAKKTATQNILGTGNFTPGSKGVSSSQINVRTGRVMSEKEIAAKAKKQQLQEAGFTKGSFQTSLLSRGGQRARQENLQRQADIIATQEGQGVGRQYRMENEIKTRRQTERVRNTLATNMNIGASSPLPSDRASDRGGSGGSGSGNRGGGSSGGMGGFMAFTAITSSLAMLAPVIDENSTSMDYFKKNISDAALQVSTLGFLLSSIPLGDVANGFKGLLVNVGLMSAASKANAVSQAGQTTANNAATVSENAETASNLAAVLANPFVLLAAAVLGSIAAFAMWQSSIAEAARAEKEKAIKEGDVNTAMLKASEEAEAMNRMASPLGDTLGTVGGVSVGDTGIGAAGGAALGAAIGSFIAPGIGTAIGAGLGAVAGGVMGANLGGNEFQQDPKTAIQFAKALSLTTKATQSFEKAQESTSAKMEEFRNGTASAIDVMNAASQAQLQAAQASVENEEAIKMLERELLEDNFSYFRAILSTFGLVDSNADIKKRKEEEVKQLKTSQKELDKSVLASAQPGINLLSRQTANSGGSFQDVLNLIKQRDKEQGTNVAEVMTRADKEAAEKGIEGPTKRMEREFNNLAKEAQRTRAAFNAMNLGFDSVNAAASAASVGINNLIDAQDGSTSRLGQTISTLEAGVTNAAQGMADADWNSAVQEASSQLSKLGGDPAQIQKFEENLNAVNQAQKFFAQASADAKEKLKADFERGVQQGTGTVDEKRSSLADAVVGQLDGFAPEVKDRIKAAIKGGELSEADMQEIVNGNFGPLQKALGELGEKTLSQVLPALQKVKESEEQLFKIQKQRIDLENKYIDAQKRTIDVQLEAAKIMEEFGGAAVTPEMQTRAIVDKANLDAAQSGVSPLVTGSAAEFAQRSGETRAQLQELGATRTAAASGDRAAQQAINPEFEAREQRLNDLAAKEQDTIKALIDVKRQELKLIKAKNKAEKDAIDALLGGNIEAFLDQQAGAGAIAASATGDSRLASQFGFTAFGSATKQLQEQEAAGVRTVFGRDIKQVTQSAYGFGLSNAGLPQGAVQGMAEVAAGTTAEEQKIEAEARTLAAQLVPAAQNQELAAKLQLDAAKALEMAAQKQMEAAVQNVQARAGQAGAAPAAPAAPAVPAPAPAQAPAPAAQVNNKPPPSSPFSPWIANMSGPKGQAMLSANTNYVAPTVTPTMQTTPTPVPQLTSSAGSSSQTSQSMSFNSEGIISAVTGLQSVLNTIATNTTPKQGAGNQGFDLTVIDTFTKSIETFIGRFQSNVEKLAALSFNITIAPVNVTVNLMDGGIFQAIKNYANNEIITSVKKELDKYKVGPNGRLTKSSSTV